MPLSSGQRRELAAQGNRLKANIILRADELADSAIEHVRRAFGERELIKVRFSTDDRDECKQAAEALAQRVPCEVVQRVGRVALLYRAKENADDEK